MNAKKEGKTKESALERLALGATRRIGSPASLVAHTIFFVGIFALEFLGISSDRIMLILTTVVSLEAIYLSVFIQMSVNRQEQRIDEVSEEVEEISEELEKDDQEDNAERVEDLRHIKKIEKTLEELLRQVRERK
jgi:uncharacterized membrane protein